MTWTGNYDHGNNTDTVYAKPRPHSATPSWANDVVAAVDNDDDDRQKTFASLLDATRYSVFKQAGGSPAANDPVVAVMESDVVAAINADATQQTLQSNTASIKSTVEGLDTNVSALPVPPSASAIVSAINANATQQTLQANASTAATESTAVRKLSEADVILVDSSGVQVLKTYERGTTTELIPTKTAKKTGGADLTDPTTERLAGYSEE